VVGYEKAIVLLFFLGLIAPRSGAVGAKARAIKNEGEM
jgi:hypothetical protein